jgi:trehalose 6-phosphate phosphatase
LTELAQRYGLVCEPGKRVIELRPPGMDKGRALRGLVDDQNALSVVFVGDDLGDLAAFEEIDALRERGMAGLLVCSGSDEEPMLADRADLVVDGPDGVAEVVTALVRLFRAGVG